MRHILVTLVGDVENVHKACILGLLGVYDLDSSPVTVILFVYGVALLSVLLPFLVLGSGGAASTVTTVLQEANANPVRSAE